MIDVNKKLSEKVTELHRLAFTVDAHFDLTYDVANHRERGAKEVIKKHYLNSLRSGGFDLVVSAMFIDDLFLPEMGLRRALDQVSFLHDEMDETPGMIRLCRTMAEVRKANAVGEIGIILSLEGTDPIQNDIGLLRIFYELGVRGLGLVWSRRNYVADGAFFAKKEEGKKGGLTPFGVEVVKKAEHLGMFIDLSHINDEGFWDVAGIATKPFIVSHSNCRELAGSMRNLTDDQIKAVAEHGGVIGMNSVNLLTRTDKSATVSDLVDHIDHIVKLASIDHVGIGFDICNSFNNWVNFEQSLPAKDIIKDHSKLFELTTELVVRGYSDKDILAILGANFLRVFEEILG